MQSHVTSEFNVKLLFLYLFSTMAHSKHSHV